MYSKLTIIIPTFNREKRLLNLLNGLYREDRCKEVIIKILDNCSDYDVKKSISDAFDFEQLTNLELIKRPFNIGMAANIASPFLYCNTKWLWIIGDDDEVMPGCISNVLLDIEKYDDYGYIKYEFVNPNKLFLPITESIDIDTIDDYLDYYNSGKHSTGNMIFLSNNLFNMEILKPYLGKAIEWSYTYIGHIIPIIYGLTEGEIKCKFLPFKLVSFHFANPDQTWNRLTVLLGLTTINNIDFKISNKNRNILSCILSKNFTHDEVAKNILLIENRQRRNYFYKSIYNSIFKHHSHFSRINLILFYTNHLFNINIYRIKYNFIQYLKKIKYSERN